MTMQSVEESTDDVAVLTPRGERWVARTGRWLDLLAVIFLADVFLVWSFPKAPNGVQVGLDAVAWLVWAGFAVDYVVRWRLARSRRTFVKTHKLDLVMVLVPMLRLLRVALLLRKSLASVSTERIAGSIVSIVVLVVLFSAFLEWRVEYDAPGATITTFRAALWWAVVTTTTVGYGDYTPVTAPGRAIAGVVMVVGIGLIGTISATVAAWFVSRPVRGSAVEADGPAIPDVVDSGQAALLERLDVLAAQQVEIRRVLERMSERT